MRNVTDLEAALRTKTAEIEALMRAQGEQAEAADRARSPEEVASVERLLTEARDLRGQIDRKRGDVAITDEIARMTAGLPDRATPILPGQGAPEPRGTLGDQFVASSAFDYFRRGMHRTTAAWRSPSAELFAATLTTDPASGGDLIVPQYLAGIRPLAIAPPVVASLMASGVTNSNLITYMVEKTFTNAADTVAEGGAKPESALIFDAASDAVRKIAHWLPVTEEMLEDAPQIRSYIDARLVFGVQLVENDQLLQGSGIAPDILGVRNRPGIAAAVAKGASPDTNAEAIYRQMVAITTSSLMQPDGVVMHPLNWSTIELSKTTTGEYMAGGPFAARITPTLWGVRVVLTPVIPSGTATVGAWAQAAQFFRKGGIRVEASNSHQDFFVKNLVAIRAEERGALAVYRPGAFGDVTGLA